MEKDQETSFAKKNIELEKELAQKNRELEVEAALEKVRVVALAMRVPADMLEVCRIICDQLGILRISEIRNVQTAVFNEAQKTYTNYEYYRLYDQTFITEIEYGNHPVHNAFAEQMLSGPGLLFTHAFEGDELREWIAYQKASGQFADPHLDEVLSVNYYWFSLGPVAWGITLYAPVNEAELEIIKRFRNVFDLAYRRFADIQKAEEQARESQIQLALERVRARTMAMQHSSELKDAASILFQQVELLEVNSWTSGFQLWDEDDKAVTVWTCTAGVVQQAFRLPVAEEDFFMMHVVRARKNGEALYVEELSGKTLESHYKYMARLPGLANNFKSLSDEGIALPQSQVNHAAFFTYGYLLFITYKPIPEAHDIFKRFAKVFDQTYTRFLDLQKAEKQAREAQIQLGLERVRARAMAMQSSEELNVLVGTVFEELTKLDFVLTRCLIMIFDPDTLASRWWMANSEVPEEPANYLVQNHNHPPYLAYLKAWHGRILQWQYTLKGKVKSDWDDFLFVDTELSGLPGVVIEGMKAPAEVLLTASFNNFGCLTLVSIEPLSDEHSDILLRFAKVFDMSYTRFNDLKQAEAQARESQIQLALERVRARTMAMQHSSELADASFVLDSQVRSLGIATWGCAFNIYGENKSSEWFSSGGGSLPTYKTPRENIFLTYYEAGQRGESMLIREYAGEVCARHYEYLCTIPVMGEALKAMKAAGGSFPVNQVDHVVYFKYGYLLFITLAPAPEAHDIFKRFTAVFEQTYRRFLDLQKAEVQAKEARIEAALERVRSKTMAMHSTKDVAETVAVMFDECLKLGVESKVRCGVGIISETKHMEVWTAYSGTDEKVGLVIGRLDMTSHQMLSGVFDHWKNKAVHSTYRLTGEDQRDYYRAVNHSEDYHAHFKLADLPERQFQNAFYFREGFIYVFSQEQLTSEIVQIFTRFAAVFGQTYRRYLDLQKAEAQAREARIEAALEKVRGKAMAMYNSADLTSTASMAFTELRKLGINPKRCGVGMISKDSRKAALYTATSSAGEDSLGLVGWVTLGGHPVLDKIYGSFLKGEDYFAVLKGKQLEDYYHNLLSGLPLASLPGFHAKDEQYGHFFSFTDGCLYAWADKPYDDIELKTLKRFASVIDLTFRRYIELQKSEASTREAVRAASLDRVRAEIASMRSTSDLQRITPLVWNELTILGIPFIRCGVFIMDEPAELIHTYLSTPDGKALASFDLPFDAEGIGRDVLPAWRKKQVASIHWSAEEFANYTNTLIQQGAVTAKGRYVTEHPDTSLDLHFFPFLQGMLYVGSPTPLNVDAMDLAQSLAGAFSTAYARYEDFNQLELAKGQVEHTLTELRSAQTQLVQREKMASLGELTAGIAHEIQNPLNFVNNFSEVSVELLQELREGVEAGHTEDVMAIADDLTQNLEKINHHGRRADSIVKGMLEHSRTGSGQRQPANINAIADEFLKLSYHGLRAKDKSFNADLVEFFDPGLPQANIVQQDIGRVLVNIFNNAFYAVNQRQKTAGADYTPTVTISTLSQNGQVLIRIKDNGNGIPAHVKDKIMQPFFTTKPTGEGTGLGLSLSYDIVVKGHGGSINVETKEGEFTEFIVMLPIS